MVFRLFFRRMFCKHLPLLSADDKSRKLPSQHLFIFMEIRSLDFIYNVSYLSNETDIKLEFMFYL